LGIYSAQPKQHCNLPRAVRESTTALVMGTSRDVFFIPIQAINYPLVSEKEMAENYQQCHILSFIQAEIVIVQSYHRRALFACFSLFFCPIADLQRSIVKLKIVGTASFLTTSLRS